VAAELELGVPTDQALESLRERSRSQRIDLIVAAIVLQRRAGGNLAKLLRSIGATIEESDRLRDEARAASAQARFTSTIVLAMPVAALVLAELAAPGMVARVAGSSIGIWMVGVALGLQLAGALLVRRISRVEL
jgi:tight adherence protein B